MAAEIVNLDVVQGSTFGIRIDVLDDDGVTPVNLNGWAIRGVVKNKYSDLDSNILINLNPSITDAVNGIIQINLSPEQTAVLPITEAVYDVEKYSLVGSSHAVKLIKGKFRIYPEVTSGTNTDYNT
jgi:hypothetical protein